jgi:hypothetical protein
MHFTSSRREPPSRGGFLFAKEDVLHGEDATARWKEIHVEIAPNGNELMGAEWIKVEI